MAAKFWNVPATLAWIAAGNDDLCRELEAIPNASFLDFSIRLGCYVVLKLTNEHPELHNLCSKLLHFDELLEHPKTKGLIFKHPSITELQRSLVEALVSGKVNSWAVKDRAGNRVPICAADWDGLELCDDHYQHSGIIAQPSNSRTGRELILSDIRLSVEDVKGTWHCKEKAKTRARSEGKDLWCKHAEDLLNNGHPPDKAKLSRRIKADLKLYQTAGTVEKAIRSWVNLWISRNRGPENPENPGTTVRD